MFSLAEAKPITMILGVALTGLHVPFYVSTKISALTGFKFPGEHFYLQI